MTKSLLLLGGVLPAVQFVRRVSEYVENIHIIAQEDDAIVYSKHGEKFLYAHPENCHSVIKAWIDAQSSDVKQWLVIPCSEFFVQYIEEFRNTGFEVFALPSEAVDVFCDKKLMYIWLASLGVQISDFLHFSDDLDFTQSKKYIIKSSRTSDDYRVPFKTKVIKSIEELNFIRKEIPKHYWDNFVIQRLYENNQSLSYGGVWIDGKEVSSIIVKQVRQYPKGVTSYAVKLSDAADLQLIKKVIDNISSNIILHGFFELEFIKNEAGLYPIDLNPRLWGWSNFLFYNYQLINYISILDKLEIP